MEQSGKMGKRTNTDIRTLASVNPNVITLVGILVIGDRIRNDQNFTCHSLTGKTIESFKGYYEGDLSNGVDIILIKVKENDLYQKFFLDATIGFWEEWDEETALFDLEDMNETNFVKKHDLQNREIRKIECIGDINTPSSIYFEIDNTKLCLENIDKDVIDSETVVNEL